MESKQAYPLQWPVGYKRSTDRERSRFRQSLGSAQSQLKEEVRMLKGTDLVVSTNLKVRVDGDIYANELGKNISDPGVAIYFKYKRKTVSMCCDKYRYVWENMYALACGIEALRGMERWGVSEFLDRAFTGFTALPMATKDQWWNVLGCEVDAPESEIKARYRDLVKTEHPDAPTGSDAKFKRIYDAMMQGLYSKKS